MPDDAKPELDEAWFAQADAYVGEKLIRKGIPDNAIIEAMARAVCANSLGGFCQNIGGDLGCRNGRGVRGREYCVATRAQLVISGHAEQAGAALDAYRAATADDGK